jgi:hypothetical protein
MRNYKCLVDRVKKAGTESDLLKALNEVAFFVGRPSKKINKVKNAIMDKLSRDRSSLARKLDKYPVGYVIRITDYSEYVAERCSDGGCYSFTTDFVKLEDGTWEVSYGTSCTGFSYCSYYGTFCNDDCDEKCADRVLSRSTSKQVAFLIAESTDDEEVVYGA